MVGMKLRQQMRHQLLQFFVLRRRLDDDRGEQLFQDISIGAQQQRKELPDVMRHEIKFNLFVAGNFYGLLQWQ
jgi:hypothetical protein